MTLPTAEKITNLWRYGTETTPDNLLDPSITNHPSGSINVPTPEYMEKGAGRFVNAANFEIAKKFFDTSNNLPPGTYRKEDIANHFGMKSYGYSVHQIYLGVNDKDHAERTYIWGSTKFKISDDAEFVVNEDGSREIRNFSIVPKEDDNFNFEGGPESMLGADALMPVIDPSGIGKTVALKFTDLDKVQTRTLTATDFAHAQATVIEADTSPSNKAKVFTKTLIEMADLKNKLFSDGSHPIRSLDAENRPIIYGNNLNGNLNNDLNGYVTSAITPVGKNKISIDQSMYHIRNPKNGDSLPFGLGNPLYPFIKNGINYVAGDGDDKITGTDKNDVLHGNSGNDTMKGGKGDNIYDISGNRAGEVDTIIVDGDGKGSRIVLNGQTISGTFKEANDLVTGQGSGIYYSDDTKYQLKQLPNSSDWALAEKNGNGDYTRQAILQNWQPGQLGLNVEHSTPKQSGSSTPGTDASHQDNSNTPKTDAQQKTVAFSTGDHHLDQLLAALSSSDDAAFSRVSADIAQLPQTQAQVQQGHDQIAAQQREEQQPQNQDSMRRSC